MSEIGLRTSDVIRLIADMDNADSPDFWADQQFNANHIEDILDDHSRHRGQHRLQRPRNGGDQYR